MANLERDDILITVEELADSAALRTVIDCRFNLMQPEAGRIAYLQGHIPGAVYAHLDNDLAGPVSETSGRHPLPSSADFETTLRRLGVRDTLPVVVYDDAGGAIAARAWWLLRWAGHGDVRLLDGGFAAWRRSRLPLESGEEGPNAGSFEVVPDMTRVLETGELASDPGGPSRHRLIDARDNSRYRGESEPIDTVAGHIPGSLNLPFSECLDQDGHWHSRRKLRERFAAVLGNESSEPWSVMCGSGVTACHLAISGLLAGFDEPRLYVGSWSEWIRDASRPVARE